MRPRCAALEQGCNDTLTKPFVARPLRPPGQAVCGRLQAPAPPPHPQRGGPATDPPPTSRPLLARSAAATRPCPQPIVLKARIDALLRLKESARLEAQSQILHGLLPQDVIERVVRGGRAAAAKHHENISVLFADIVRPWSPVPSIRVVFGAHMVILHDSAARHACPSCACRLGCSRRCRAGAAAFAALAAAAPRHVRLPSRPMRHFIALPRGRRWASRPSAGWRSHRM